MWIDGRLFTLPRQPSESWNLKPQERALDRTRPQLALGRRKSRASEPHPNGNRKHHLTEGR